MTDEAKMRAIIWTRYGSPDVLKLDKVLQPIPKTNEILIKVHAATVMAGDCELRSLKMPLFLGYPMRLYTGIRRPKRLKILGSDFSGVVEEVGADVKRFQIGDEIFGNTGLNFGSYAEWNTLPADKKEVIFLKKPSNLSHEEAATIPVGGINALHFLKKGNIQPGQHILVIGAGGSIGIMVVQIAKYIYEAEVTAIDSTDKLDMLKSIGANFTIDFTQEDYTKRSERFDVIIDVVGKGSFSKIMRLLKKKGIYICANPSLRLLLFGKFISLIKRKKVITGVASEEFRNLSEVKGFLESGKIKVVIDKQFPLEKTAEAHAYVETGNKKGNVVITIH